VRDETITIVFIEWNGLRSEEFVNVKILLKIKSTNIKAKCEPKKKKLSVKAAPRCGSPSISPHYSFLLHHLSLFKEILFRI
jgi:hypothetical protein